MRPTAAQHPSDAELAAFALGKLDRTVFEWVSRHLDDCPTCRALIEQTPSGSLVKVLRGANAAQASSPRANTTLIQGSHTKGPLPPPVPRSSINN
jgi:anti-sigma factor ChrR (cupin superfamily)